MTQSLLWYDFETSGTDPGFDRALQFAAVRTDLNLQPIEAPINLFCDPGQDVVPDPMAMRVTGLKMSQIREQGLPENEFARQIHEQFSRPNTCVVGYNSIRFDDEFTRYLLYRNFYDPYAREWQGGNSRWDVIDMFRMAAALRPQGVAWPTNDAGDPSFRLELLTAANGIAHEGAHDAVADVLATIGMVKVLRDAQPKLYEYLFNLRRKKSVLDQLYPLGKHPIVHVSSMYPAKQLCTTVVLPLTVHPTNPNGVICFDLTKDPSDLIELGPEQLHQRIFSKQSGANEPRIPLKTIHVNRAPAISPMGTLKDRMDQLGIDSSVCEKHQQRLQQTSGIVEKIAEVFSMSDFESTTDPDQMLYQGDFFNSNDRQIMSTLHESAPEALSAYSGHFDDQRLPEMLFRFRARNFPDSLDESEQQRWSTFVQSKFDSIPGKSRQESLQAMLLETPDDEVLRDLESYFNRN